MVTTKSPTGLCWEVLSRTYEPNTRVDVLNDAFRAHVGNPRDLAIALIIEIAAAWDLSTLHHQEGESLRAEARFHATMHRAWE